MTKLCSIIPFSVLLFSFAAGCSEKGPALGTVSGNVTLDGDPVEDAYVEFFPLFAGGTECRSAKKTDADGYFEMQYSVERSGVLIGKHQVQISTRDWEKQPNGSNKEIPERIPGHYFGSDSILEFDVKEGENVANFDLAKKKPK